MGKSSGQYIYALKPKDLERDLLKVGELYHWIDRQIKPLYADQQVFQVFERVYREHFTIVGDRVEVRSPAELHSGCVQSPDDLDAAYREKNGSEIRGHVISKKMQNEEITPVQTAIRGRESHHEISIERNASGDYEVYCPLQTAKYP